jgi:oligopeptide transport system substrate-binding protein
MQRKTRFIKLLLILALLSTACRVGTSPSFSSSSSSPTGQTAPLPASIQSIPRNQILMLDGGESTNSRDYDPATITSSGGFSGMVFSGLVSFSPDLTLIPELAESWQVSGNGTVYTFKLRNSARFQDGRPVTSADLIYSWERAADPKTSSDTVLTYLGDIVGLKEMHTGKAEHITGLKSLDDHTLQVTIDAPKPYFLLKLTYPTAYVVDRKNIESGPNWYRTPNGTGPYQLREWKSFEYMLYERNPNYYLQQPEIRYVLEQQNTNGLLSYEGGETDISGVGLYNLARVLDPKETLHNELLSGASLCTSYMTFDVTQPPFDDVKVRQAFTMAFDRQKYIDVVLRGAALPAKGLYPPALPGYNSNLAGLTYDPDRARQLLSESKYGSAANLPTIVFTQSGTGYFVGYSVAALAQMWKQTLGITITVESIDSNKYSEEVAAGHHGQIISGGWCADYPDPENFADALFHSGAEYNRGHYNSPQLDALLEQARVERDVTKRIAMYQQAEQVIVNDAPALFLSHSLSYLVVKPYIKGYVLTPIDVPITRYLSIDPEKLP